MERKKIDKWVIIRTLVLVLALVNQVLVALGKSPIPINDAMIETLISTGWTIISAGLSWWYNSNITQEAIIAQEYLEELKEKE